MHFLRYINELYWLAKLKYYLALAEKAQRNKTQCPAVPVVLEQKHPRVFLALKLENAIVAKRHVKFPKLLKK